MRMPTHASISWGCPCKLGKPEKSGTTALPVWIDAPNMASWRLEAKGSFASNGDAEGIQGICASRQRHGHGGRHHHWRRLLRHRAIADRRHHHAADRGHHRRCRLQQHLHPAHGEHYSSLAAAKQAGAPTRNIGLFINNVISFLIVAFVLFMAIKAMNQLRRMQAEDPASKSPPSREVALLTEIRDALVKRG